MSVIADVAFGAAPIAGGVLMGVLAGTIKGPDYRGMIKDDLELLEKIPPEDVELRAALKSSIDVRIADLIVITERSRQLRDRASSYKGNWRDGVLFLCSVLFTIVWWNVPHDRTNWLLTLIFLIALSAMLGLYAARGILREIRFSRRTAGSLESAG
jgi:hypothetical protein